MKKNEKANLSVLIQGLGAILVGLTIIIIMNLNNILIIMEKLLDIITKMIVVIPDSIPVVLTLLMSVSNGVMYLFGILLFIWGCLKILGINLLIKKEQAREVFMLFSLISFIFLIITFIGGFNVFLYCLAVLIGFVVGLR
jgi:hypothetical protein